MQHSATDHLLLIQQPSPCPHHVPIPAARQTVADKRSYKHKVRLTDGVERGPSSPPHHHLIIRIPRPWPRVLAGVGVERHTHLLVLTGSPF
jgi:hypothetical protein